MCDHVYNVCLFLDEEKLIQYLPQQKWNILLFVFIGLRFIMILQQPDSMSEYSIIEVGKRTKLDLNFSLLFISS